MSEIDADVRELVRDDVLARYTVEIVRAAQAAEDGDYRAALWRRWAAYWRHLDLALDGLATMTADDEFVVRWIRRPHEERALAQAKITRARRRVETGARA